MPNVNDSTPKNTTGSPSDTKQPPAFPILSTSSNPQPNLPSFSSLATDPITRSHLEFYEKEVLYLRGEVATLRDDLEKVRVKEVKKLEQTIENRAIGRIMICFLSGCAAVLAVVLSLVPKEKW
ncbi:hypothetical protein JCM5353_008100 [Sporobolomyces roseus]